MTGDQIRAVTFPRHRGGYEVRQVRDLMALLAALLDEGMSVEAFMPRDGIRRVGVLERGYDAEAVDQFLAGHGYAPWAWTGDRWHPGDEAAWRPDGRGAAAPGRKAPGRAARRQFARDCEARWSGVADLPGPHLRWIAGDFTQLLSLRSDGRAVVTGRRTPARETRTSTWTWTMASGGVAFRQVAGGQVADAGTGHPVFRVIGDHPCRRAWTAVVAPGQRLLKFTVNGTKYHHAVMTGVDQAGAEVLWFRLLGLGEVEVVASPDWQLTPVALTVICAVAPGLWAHFDDGQ